MHVEARKPVVRSGTVRWMGLCLLVLLWSPELSAATIRPLEQSRQARLSSVGVLALQGTLLAPGLALPLPGQDLRPEQAMRFRGSAFFFVSIPLSVLNALLMIGEIAALPDMSASEKLGWGIAGMLFGTLGVITTFVSWAFSHWDRDLLVLQALTLLVHMAFFSLGVINLASARMLLDEQEKRTSGLAFAPPQCVGVPLWQSRF